MLYKNATFSSLSIVNITNGYTWPWTFSTFDWFSLFFFPRKPIVVLKNVPWFHQFLPHPLAGLISWQLTCIARSVYINRLTSNRWWCWKPRNEKKSHHQAKQESSSEVTRRDSWFCAMSRRQIISGRTHPLKLAESSSGWQICSVERSEFTKQSKISTLMS